VIFRIKMKSDYTVIGVVEKQRTNKTAIVAVAGFFVLAAVLALASVSGLSQGELNISNNVRAVSSELKLEFEKVCDSPDTRYVVAVFEGTEIVPCVSGPATDHWENDYAKFEAAIARCVKMSAHPIAFAIYNMPVWNTDAHHEYTTYPTFIDYVAPGVDMADIYWAGTYLGATKLAASCVTTSVKIDTIKGEGAMKTTCEKMGQDETMAARCESIENVQCPYEGDQNPCTDQYCVKAVEGASGFADISGNFGDECCESIRAWCKKGVDVETKRGCGNFAHKKIYTHHCVGTYESVEVSETILHPVLLAEKAAAELALFEAEQARVLAAEQAAARVLAAEQAAEAAAAEAAEAAAALAAAAEAAEEPVAER